MLEFELGSVWCKVYILLCSLQAPDALGLEEEYVGGDCRGSSLVAALPLSSSPTLRGFKLGGDHSLSSCTGPSAFAIKNWLEIEGKDSDWNGGKIIDFFVLIIMTTDR